MLTRRQIVGNLAYKDNLERKQKKIKQEQELIKKRNGILRSIQVNKQKDIIRKIIFVAISCGLSFFVVFRSASLVSIQGTLNDVNNSIEMYEKLNGNVSVKILMERDLKKIEEVATEKLDMVDAEKSELKTINGVNDYFEEQPVKEEGLFDKIKNFFKGF